MRIPNTALYHAVDDILTLILLAAGILPRHSNDPGNYRQLRYFTIDP